MLNNILCKFNLLTYYVILFIIRLTKQIQWLIRIDGNLVTVVTGHEANERWAKSSMSIQNYAVTMWSRGFTTKHVVSLTTHVVFIITLIISDDS